jgi:hypothetical protein
MLQEQYFQPGRIENFLYFSGKFNTASYILLCFFSEPFE